MHQANRVEFDPDPLPLQEGEKLLLIGQGPVAVTGTEAGSGHQPLIPVFGHHPFLKMVGQPLHRPRPHGVKDGGIGQPTLLLQLLPPAVKGGTCGGDKADNRYTSAQGVNQPGGGQYQVTVQNQGFIDQSDP